VKALRVPVENLEPGEFALDEVASNYVLRVHRIRLGQPLVLFDPLRGVEASALLLRVSARVAVCRVEAVGVSSAVPIRNTILLQAVAKGDKVDRVIRDATALGATLVIPVTSRRCVVRYDADDAVTRQKRWQRIAVEAARQCGRGNIPEITSPLDLDAAIARLPADALRVLLAPDARVRLSALLDGDVRPTVAVFIGPEGGLLLEEQQHLLACGFLAARFGAFTLRTETAATAVLGALVDR
jgi:16S rRNA (uracil1498-N3)-methyltransferase